MTLLDVQHLDLPKMFPRAERVFRSVAWHRSVRGADRVIVISEFVRDRAVDAPRARSGADPRRAARDRSRVLTPGRRSSASRSCSIRRARWPHKNHERLFEAFALVRRERPELRLVLTGGGDFDDVPEGVEARGTSPGARSSTLMQRASALVFPSLYEGFGLPPLEAMACGCPVACSNAAALPEMVGDAARLFDPNDPRAIADAVLDVLAAPAGWARRGLERAARFSWDATARATDAVYGELL